MTIPAPYVRLNPMTIVSIDGAEYRPDYVNGRVHLTHTITGEVFRCQQPGGAMEMPTTKQFLEMQMTGQAVTKYAGSTNAIRRSNETSEWTRDQLVRMGKQGARAIRMLLITQMLDDRGTPNGRIATARALDELWTEDLARLYGPRPSPDSVLKWRKERGYLGNRRARDMVLRTGQKITDTKTNSDHQKILWGSVVAARKEGKGQQWLSADYNYQLLLLNDGRHQAFAKPNKPYKPYSSRTIRRYFNAVESDAMFAEKIEKEATKQDWSGAGKPLTADLVMQYVIVDHTWLDVHVVCPQLQLLLGRPYLTLAIDVKSRAIVGWLITFRDTSSWSVTEILRRIVRLKRPPALMAERYPILPFLCGKPGCLILDNADEFRSHNLEAAARDAGFSIRLCPVKQPTYRAIGERAIGTINRLVAEFVPGAAMTIRDARRFNFNAESHAVVMLDELEAAMNQIIASYNVEPHDGIGDKQPALVFQEHINRFGINDFTDFDSFARDIMSVVPNAQLSATGIRAFNLRYGGRETVTELLRDLVPLEPRRQRREQATATVEFRYDPMDISRIHVWNRRTRRYVTLQCTDETYADGMPEWLNDHIRDESKKLGLAFNTEAERRIALGRLIEAMKNIDPASYAESRKRYAKLCEIPRLRQITGNIVDVITAPPSAVFLGDFIAHDRARVTALDDMILSPRSGPRATKEKTALELRRENVALAQQQANTAPRERRLPGRGGF
ncbi:transposase family protein [Novosphingobium flavum]|uniref:Transposase family protein n=1 Tax=Novosphingobium aerophilum TaxID=2839843 RepID=A0A7X1KCL3_9SPHN|nr:DDE-type integrase/transposase/recombinase [Novosphingobium aerophilum]MBC2652398.1 transposase family protein [Novosphingobium aerophilum]MBC2662329.1 transposase family protein [Novosphingobium aerophilum]